MAGGFDDNTLPGEGEQTAVDVAALRPGDLVDGRYRLVQLLGVGGMGEVWQTEHVALRRPMALKLLRAAEFATEHQRARFLREARVVATIEHPGVIEVTDFGELPSGGPFIAMSLLVGRTLQQVITDDGPLPWPRAVSLVQQIADALAEAHRQDVVHRDLKPENVFISPGPPEHATVIDFGIARCTTLDSRSAKLTATGSVFGTPGYMSPEQIRGRPADARADIYALGCVAHELLTGGRLFDGELFERLEAHLYREPPQLPRALPSGLIRTIERCLAKDPDDRFRSMDEVTAALALAAGQPKKRTEIAPGHVPVAPPGMKTEASRPTAAAFAPEFTAPLMTTAVPAEPKPQPYRRGVGVAAISAAVGLAVLGLLYAAWSRPATSPASTAEAPPVAPTSTLQAQPPESSTSPQPPTSFAPVAKPPPVRAPVQSDAHDEPTRSEEAPVKKPRKTKRRKKQEPKPSGPQPGEDGVHREIFGPKNGT